MAYLGSVLGQGEQILNRSRLSLAPYWLWFLFAALLVGAGVVALVMAFGERHWPVAAGLALLILGALVVLRIVLAYFSTELLVTDQRVIARVGFASRRVIELQLSKVEGVAVNQRILGRIFRYGDISVSGTGGSHETILGIARPDEFQRHLHEALANAASARR